MPDCQNESSYQGRLALVTGGARRIGACIVRCLHQRGLNVAIHYRSSEGQAQTLADELNAQRTDSAFIMAGDLENESAIEQVANDIRQVGELAVLVNNASAFFPTPVDALKAAHWNVLFASNARGPAFLTTRLAPLLAAHHGAVVNITDANTSRDGHLVYQMAKCGLTALTRVLAKDLAPAVRVNAVAPGPILAPKQADDAAMKQLIERTALGRSGKPEDIAAAVAFLALDAGYVTGATLRVDGGLHLG